MHCFVVIVWLAADGILDTELSFATLAGVAGHMMRVEHEHRAVHVRGGILSVAFEGTDMYADAQGFGLGSPLPTPCGLQAA